MPLLRYLVLVLAVIILESALPVIAQPTVQADRFDNGKMWTFEYAPVDYFEETYDLDLDEPWFDRARLGALRIPGCTASFVSSYGLVLTNHHCSRNAIVQVSEDSEELLANGFYAPGIQEERRVPGMYADQLIAINDVTDEIYEATENAQTDAERASFRQEAIASIQQRLVESGSESGDSLVVEVIPLYQGARYSAYTYKRYVDMRLVMAPEMKIGYFGGDTDNFTFPRYTLDISFFRVYENGEPFEPDEYFLWSLEGIQDGSPVFVIGNPGSTSRLETVSQLEVRRDVTDKNLLAFLVSRINALQEAESHIINAAEKATVNNALFSLKNARKAYTGQLEALNDPFIMARRKDAEEELKKAIQDDSNLQDEYGDIFASMAALQNEMRELKGQHGAFFALTNPTYSSALLRRALLTHQYLQRMNTGGETDQLQSLKSQILAIPDQDEHLGTALLSARIKDLISYLKENESMVSQVSQSKEPTERANEIMAASALATQAGTRSALDAGSSELEQDPAIDLVETFNTLYRDYQSSFSGLQAQQAEVASQIGRARFGVYGTSIPPDATFSLRIADGVVKGYPYNGTYASPFTSYFGLYDHYYSYGAGSEWDLPQRWTGPLESFDRGVPLNFSSTNDIIGGNSGSPVLNADLELVGVIFDGNIESLSGNYIYLPDKNRAVSVDARGILEALDEVYQASRIVVELSDDTLVRDK